MFNPFIPPDQVIQTDTNEQLILARPNALKVWGGVALILALITGLATIFMQVGWVGWLVTALYIGIGFFLLASRRTITIDRDKGILYFSTHHLFFEKQIRLTLFGEIDKVYLDYEEQVNQGYFGGLHLRRKWYIFLTLINGRTRTLAHYRAGYRLGQEPNLHQETRVWEALAKKICRATDKLLICTASVPGRAPRTFVDVIDQIVQRRLENLPLADPRGRQTVRLRSHPSGNLEIVIDGVTHRSLDDIADDNMRGLIQEAIDEWQLGTAM